MTNPVRPSVGRRIAAGAAAGLVGGLALTFVVMILRWAVGTPLAVDLVSDRVIPTLSVRAFARLLGRVGGPVRGKELAYIVSFAAQLGVAVAGGALYAPGALSEGDRSRRRTRLLGGAALALVWLGLVAMLWPAMASNYRGLPPGWARVVSALGLLLAFASYGAVVDVLLRPITANGDAGPASPGRRALILGGAGVALAAATGGLAATLYRRATFGANGYDGLQVRGPRTAPITPNGRFYVVTKNLVDPAVDASWWRLAVEGLVSHPRTYTFDELMALPSVRQEQTLECISNRVGSGLMSNAVWTGARVRDLLSAAGPGVGVTRVILHAADGYTHTVSLEKAMEPTTLIAYRMNGRALPARHGFPARLLVPGTYGEVHVKWLDRIELTDRPYEGYYERQGWKPYRVNTTSRFDTPASGQRLTTNPITLSGVAFAGDRGVSAVEVSLDAGSTWEPATIAYPGTRLTWSLWERAWTPPGAGTYELVVRAVDGMGQPQPSEEHGAIPAGASGLHRVKVVVA